MLVLQFKDRRGRKTRYPGRSLIRKLVVLVFGLGHFLFKERDREEKNLGFEVDTKEIKGFFYSNCSRKVEMAN